MTDRPIIFSAQMVRALPDGRKTQTRRLQFDERGRLTTWGRLAEEWQRGERDQRLWVREAWRTAAKFDATAPRNIEPRALVSYDADFDGEPNDGCRGKARRSFHMPRWASRITLDVTAVRVQRLQEISEEDARAEGAFALNRIGDDPMHAPWTMTGEGWRYDTPRDAFRALWNTLHGAGAWDANPWVVAVTFGARKGNIDA